MSHSISAWILINNTDDLIQLLLPVTGTSSSKVPSFHLPREFTSIVAVAVYILPQADILLPFEEPYIVVNKHQNAFSIIAGDVNKSGMKTLPNYYQHICSSTRGSNIDHCYSTRYACCSIPRPYFRKSHLAGLLLPMYRQRLKNTDLAKRIAQGVEKKDFTSVFTW